MVLRDKENFKSELRLKRKLEESSAKIVEEKRNSTSMW